MCRTAIGAALLRYADEFFAVGAKQGMSFVSWHNKISECRLQISDFQCAAHLIFQSAIRNLKSAIDFTPVLGGYQNLEDKVATISPKLFSQRITVSDSIHISLLTWKSARI